MSKFIRTRPLQMAANEAYLGSFAVPYIPKGIYRGNCKCPTVLQVTANANGRSGR
jgi:hypothetical protein